MVIETAALNTEELAEYSRWKGLYVEQIARWREAARTGTAQTVSVSERRESQQDRKTIRKLKQELRRKEKALAETAALLVGSKKANHTEFMVLAVQFVAAASYAVSSWRPGPLLHEKRAR